MRIKKKGERGNAANYITRTKAVRKLQVTLVDFRRLCILKGIYPRQPSNRKKASGNRNSNNTFYLVKDIKFLLHEPILQKFREHRVFLKKLCKAIGKRDEFGVKALQENEPQYTLDHILKERYPSFMDALKDMDDCLCHVFLFATLPQTDKIPLKAIEQSQRLASEFQNYMTLTNSLKKSFVSIKGVYYQANIRGANVTWLVPHQFSVPVPADVDLRVMLTFLEFYHTMMSFINYKLYSDLQLMYPPQLNVDLEQSGGWLNAFVNQKAENGEGEAETVAETGVNKKAVKKMKKRLQSILDEDQVVSMDIINQSDDIDGDVVVTDAVVDDEEEPVVDTEKPVMDGLVVFLSREVTRTTLEFILRSMGAVVCYPETSGSGSPFAEDSTKITHQIVDRPLEMIANIQPTRKYVQPQWAFDSLNASKKLAESEYAPGKKLPPHLSPFMEYDPTHGMGELTGLELNEIVEEQGEQDVADQMERLQETQATLTTTEQSDATVPVKLTAADKKKKEEAERIARAKMVMSNKKRKLYEAIERKTNKDTEKKRVLAQKKQKLKSNN